jgi:hypothetical protein
MNVSYGKKSACMFSYLVQLRQTYITSHKSDCFLENSYFRMSVYSIVHPALRML